MKLNHPKILNNEIKPNSEFLIHDIFFVEDKMLVVKYRVADYNESYI